MEGTNDAAANFQPAPAILWWDLDDRRGIHATAWRRLRGIGQGSTAGVADAFHETWENLFVYGVLPVRARAEAWSGSCDEQRLFRANAQQSRHHSRRRCVLL